jgi:hypothetical protein
VNRGQHNWHLLGYNLTLQGHKVLAILQGVVCMVDNGMAMI